MEMEAVEYCSFSPALVLVYYFMILSHGLFALRFNQTFITMVNTAASCHACREGLW